MIKRFGTALRRHVNTVEAYKLLPYGTWTAGGCWTLAHAVQRHIGGQLVAVGYPGRTMHVAVRCGDTIIDADGAQAAKTYLKRWSRREGMPLITDPGGQRLGMRPFTAPLRREASGIPCDLRAARVLTAWMRTRQPAARCPR